MIDNVETALSKACEITNSCITDFTGAPVFFFFCESGAHEWIFDFGKIPTDLEQFI